MAEGGGDSAIDVMRSAIYAVELNRSSYRKFQTKLQEITFDKWRENTDAQEYIGVKDFGGLAEGLQKNLDLPDKEFKELLLMHNLADSGKVNKFEVQFDAGNMQTRYVFFALCKRGDLTDLVYAHYSLEAKSKRRKVKVKVGTDERSYLWGLIKKSTPIYEKREVSLDKVQHDPERNDYFRYQAITGIADKGLVERSKLKYIDDD